jgi:aromatic ring hydroxylase
VGDFIRKYVTRRNGVSAENQYRANHLISDLLTSEYASIMQIAGVHGGGSPIMEDIAIMGNYDLESKKKLARYLAGIKED